MGWEGCSEEASVASPGKAEAPTLESRVWKHPPDTHAPPTRRAVIE
jgi:hypothetical protein